MTYQLMLFPKFKDKAVTLSYDDGKTYDKHLIEIMCKYGLKGTFNLCSGLLENPSCVQADELKEVYIDTGNEIAIHGQRHLSLASISEPQMVQEIASARKRFEDILGQIITGMAYANGSYDDRAVKVLKACGISYCRTTVSTCDFNICDDWLRLPSTCHHNNERLFELVDKFLNQPKASYFWSNQPKLFYLWGHSHELERDNDWNKIERFAKLIGNRDDVWYVTNGEIVRYVNAFKNLIFSLDGSMVYNPCHIDVYIKTPSDKQMIIHAGQMVKIL